MWIYPLQSQQLNKGLLTKQVAWQQRVDHNISVTLDTATHQLKSFETVAYINNSPNSLTEIWFHIWPNAFKNNKTGYGKEAILHGNEKYFNAVEKDRGELTGLDFMVNGTAAKWEEHPVYNDIIRLILPAPLESGAKAIITTPFVVKLPWLFSRMGVNENIYSVTQWYPKPAVYDVNGWNTFPYQDQGEYYSEFGTYEVAITLPAGFRVGATGKMLDSSEWRWMEKIAAGDTVRKGNETQKTLHFYQENIPDFAWFASPDFKITMAEVVLPDSHRIKTMVFNKVKYNSKKIVKKNEKTISSAIEKALKYYSKRVGNYPYDYCSVVIGPLQGAGGMEYPMITICGDASEATVIHEVGHNWFQCMLGSQERNNPWMDESINTFYHTQAASDKEKEFSPGDKIDPSSELLQFRFTHDIGLFQDGDLHSSEYHPNNYGTIVYAANPRRFMYLQEFLGRRVFDSCMKYYFVKWQFKHPLPDDIQSAFESISHKNLSWFFKDLMGQSAPDYAIQSVKRNKTESTVKIKNKGIYQVPVKLTFRDGELKNSVWLNGNDTAIKIKPNFTQVSLNASGYLTESNFANNEARTKGLFKTWNSLQVGFPNLYQRGSNRVWFIPNVFSSNSYDGFMPGLLVSNFNLPRRNWEWWAVPMYGIKSKNITGIASIQRNVFHKNGPIALTQIGMNFSSFGFSPDTTKALNSYYHFAPRMELFLKRKKHWIQNSLELEFVKNRIANSSWNGPADAKMMYSQDLQNDLVKVAFIRHSYKKLSPSNFLFQLEGGKNYSSNGSADSSFQFAKIGFSADKFIPIRNRKLKPFGIYLKGFAESFLFQKNKGNTNGVYNPLVSGGNGSNDYGFRQTMFRRSEGYGNGNIWNNQLLPGGNGMRMVPNVVANSFVAGMNTLFDIYPGLPLKVYGDFAIADNAMNEFGFFYTAGLNLSTKIGSGIVGEINLPLLYSTNAQAGTTPKHFYSYINFRVVLNMYNPLRLIRSIYQ